MNTTNALEVAALPASEDTALHPFERAGLGLAPFVFTGMNEKTYQACHGAPIQPGGSCAYCGNGIRYCYGIKSADGRSFVVGCDCVFKLEDERNTNDETSRQIRRLADKIRAAERAQAAKARAAKAAAVSASLEVSLADEATRATLATLPHPRGFDGLTLLSWCEWMVANAGAKGRGEVAKAIKAATK